MFYVDLYLRIFASIFALQYIPLTDFEFANLHKCFRILVPRNEISRVEMKKPWKHSYLSYLVRY